MRTILFVCGHNAGRSQMAEAFATKLIQERGLDVRARSAGTSPGERINPLVERAMEEVGISMTGRRPKILNADMAAEADTIITMGCGVDTESCPARFLVSEDWGLDDPAGAPVERVREIRDLVRVRVEELLARMGS